MKKFGERTRQRRLSTAVFSSFGVVVVVANATKHKNDFIRLMSCFGILLPGSLKLMVQFLKLSQR